jgi:hypothetical protein
MADYNYDAPQYNVRQLAHMGLPATAASTSVAKFPAHCAMKIKRLSVIVGIAGTATGAGYDVLNGTTSVGAITLGTGAALTLGSLVQDITLASGGYLDIKTKAASATLAADVGVEFETPFPASLT